MSAKHSGWKKTLSRPCYVKPKTEQCGNNCERVHIGNEGKNNERTRRLSEPALEKGQGIQGGQKKKEESRRPPKRGTQRQQIRGATFS